MQIDEVFKIYAHLQQKGSIMQTVRFGDYGSASEFFDATRAAVQENKDIAARIAYLKQKSTHASDYIQASRKDTNGTGAIDDAIEYEEMTRELVQKNEALKRLCLNVMDGITDGLGLKYSEVIYLRVLNAKKWDEVTEAMSYGRATIFRLYNVACDYCDSVGLGGAKDGLGV